MNNLLIGAIVFLVIVLILLIVAVIYKWSTVSSTTTTGGKPTTLSTPQPPPTTTTTVPTTTTVDGYDLFDNAWCVPGSGEEYSNIGLYKKGTELEAKEKCLDTESCKGFSYNKDKREFILKKTLTGQSAPGTDGGSRYKCYKWSTLPVLD